MKKIYLVAGITLLIDQITKILVHLFLSDIEIIPSFLNFTYVENTGAAWGMFDNNRMFLICVSVVTLLILSKYLKSETSINKMTMTSYGLLVGGIFGNLIDRIFRGYVIDFLNFNILGYHFPAFNIADVAIVIGVILMIIEVIRGENYGNSCKRK